MMKFQFFYDYECPFCQKAFETLIDLLPSYPGIEVEWRPIEAHPRPENCRPHTNLCIRAFYIAGELGSDIIAFHKAMFRAVNGERRNVEEGGVIAEILKGIVDGGKFLEILKSNKYAAKVNENNDLAYEKNGIWYVPAFRVPGTKIALDARGGMGVSQKEIKDFLDRVKTGS